MKYAAGRHVQANMTWNEWSMLSKAIAELHAMKLPYDTQQTAQYERFQFLDAVLAFNNYTGDRKIIQERFEHSEFKLCLCHGDLHLQNIIFNEDEHRVYLIDFETTFYGWAAYDWAVFFLGVLSGLHTIPEAAGLGRQSACRKLKSHVLEVYLKHIARLDGKPVGDVTMSDVEKMYRQIIQMENIIQIYSPFPSHYCRE